MITKALLIEEIETLDDESLEQVHQLIQRIKQEQPIKIPSLMSQLRSVQKIAAPVDFASNIDMYLNGEK